MLTANWGRPYRGINEDRLQHHSGTYYPIGVPNAVSDCFRWLTKVPQLLGSNNALAISSALFCSDFLTILIILLAVLYIMLYIIHSPHMCVKRWWPIHGPGGYQVHHIVPAQTRRLG